MLNKEEELGCLEILKANFPKLQQRGLVIGLYEFLTSDVNLQNFICLDKTVKEAAAVYAQSHKPYIILDESEGYQCIFFKGQHIKAHYDVTHSKLIGFSEETTESI